MLNLIGSACTWLAGKGAGACENPNKVLKQIEYKTSQWLSQTHLAARRKSHLLMYGALTISEQRKRGLSNCATTLGTNSTPASALKNV
jgi:hypothetical protein